MWLLLNNVLSRHHWWRIKINEIVWIIYRSTHNGLAWSAILAGGRIEMGCRTRRMMQRSQHRYEQLSQNCLQLSEVSSISFLLWPLRIV